ncbi:MAG: hydantoinase/oxoprolinase family protein, partial [Chloroflexi bacterium]|nr:hydantoinase/oxoprolinase family protein [Chloroflexota bacterium]
LTPLDEGRSRAAVKELIDGGAESITVSLLHSYANPAHERRIGELVHELDADIPVSLSAEILPEFREYERALVAVMNAYVSPSMRRYLRAFVDKLRAIEFSPHVNIIRSDGGLMSVERASESPVHTMLSGPAGGVSGAAFVASLAGYPDALGFDMGGTSTDVSLIRDGKPTISRQTTLGHYPINIPSLEVRSVGAGGGSIAHVPMTGALRVGPESAGVDPGPACYGRGGHEATVTDAHVALGRIGPQVSLGGSLEIDPDSSLTALRGLGLPIGLDATGAALGIIRIVEETMAGAVRTVSIEQGADPRLSWLVAFGGAGGLHATALARSLEMPGVLVPPHGGVFSALGLLLSPPRVDLARGVLITTATKDSLDAIVTEVARTAHALLADGTVETLCDVRYLGQAHELTVPYEAGNGWSALADRFHRLHHERNGFSRPGDPVEVVAVRAVATGHPAMRMEDLPESRPTESLEPGGREVIIDNGSLSATVWNRSALGPGDRISGPAIVEEPEAK